MIHLLRAHDFEHVPLVDRVPPLLHGVVTLFSEKTCSLQTLFEISLSILLRWGRMWWDEAVLPDREALFALVEEALRGHAVLDVFARTGVEAGVSSFSNVSSAIYHDFRPAGLVVKRRLRSAEPLSSAARLDVGLPAPPLLSKTTDL